MATSVLCTASLLLFGGWKVYLRYYEQMHAYHMDGLPFMFLFALAIAIVTTPFFAAALSQSKDGAPDTVKQAYQLYLGVLGIQLGALSIVFFLLWLLGWLQVLLYVAYLWCLSALGIQ